MQDTSSASHEADAVLLRLDRILKAIEVVSHNQTKEKFNAGTAAALAIAAAFSYILGLALNQFFVLVFAQIPIGGGLLGAGIYALVALILCITMLFLIYQYLEPFLHAKFAPKSHSE